jgi:hypothetical protein
MVNIYIYSLEKNSRRIFGIYIFEWEEKHNEGLYIKTLNMHITHQ